MIFFWRKFLNYFYILFFLFCSFITGSAYSETITGANTVNSTSNNNTTQKKIQCRWHIFNNFRIYHFINRLITNSKYFYKNNGTVTVESGSSIFSNGALSSNAIQGKNQSGLTVTNSGTISAGNSKAINLLDATNSNITNNAGGIIKSNTNTITVTATNDNDANNVTINNSGEIYAEDISRSNTPSNAVKSEDDTDI